MPFFPRGIYVSPISMDVFFQKIISFLGIFGVSEKKVPSTWIYLSDFLGKSKQKTCSHSQMVVFHGGFTMGSNPLPKNITPKKNQHASSSTKNAWKSLWEISNQTLRILQTPP